MHQNKQDLRWWREDNPHDTIRAVLQRIHNNEDGRNELLLRSMRMYSNANVSGYTPTTYSRDDTADKVTLNVIKSTTDTITAMVSRTRPRPVFLTDGGNDSLRRRAKSLEKFVAGVFYKAKLYEIAPQIVLDALVFDTGVIKPYVDPKDPTSIIFERVFPGEIHVDPAEGIYGKPQQIHQTKYIPRDVLIGMFPDRKVEIEALGPGTAEDLWAPMVSLDGDNRDQVLVTESWHKESAKDAGDGRHAITISTATLAVEDWNEPEFPFVFLRWSSRLLGFFGMGLAEELVGLQVEINRILMRIQQAFKRLAVPWVFVENGTRVNKATLNNQIGAIIPYTGTPPIVRPNQTVHPEVFAHLDRLITQAYTVAGISQTFSGGDIPAGLTSGEAVREYNEVRNERYVVFTRSYEQLYMDLAQHVVSLGKKIAEDNPGWSVVSEQDKYTTSTIKWKNVDLDRDTYVLKVYPASALPPTPSGRFAKLNDMLGAGMIDQPTAKRLLDFPDLEEEMSLDRAAADNADRVIEKILDTGEYEPPEPFQDHALTLKKFQSSYNRAKTRNVPEDRLSLMREYMRATHDMLRQSQLAQQIPQQVAPGAGSPPAPGGSGVPMMADNAPQGGPAA